MINTKKQRAGKGQQLMPCMVLAVPRTNTAPLAPPGKRQWDGRHHAEQCLFLAGIHGSASSFQAANNRICPCHAEALSTTESGENRAGKGTRGQFTQWDFVLQIWRPLGFFSSGAEPWMVNWKWMVISSLHSATFCQRASEPSGLCKPPAINCCSWLSLFLFPFCFPWANQTEMKGFLWNEKDMKLRREHLQSNQKKNVST